MVFQFSSPSLCQRCKGLTVRFHGPGHWKLPFGYRQHDSFGRFPQLERLANAGCQFCGFIRSSLLSKIHNRPFSPELSSSGSFAVEVTIEDITFSHDGADDLSKNSAVWTYLELRVEGPGFRLAEHIRIECQTHTRKFTLVVRIIVRAVELSL
jgi:hypothetical protein